MPVLVADYEAQIEALSHSTVYVFDYDGVVIGPDENDIYDLPEDQAEKALIDSARRYFQIPCAGMKLRYQRHLLYQAALWKNEQRSDRGPAFDSFVRAREAGRAFVLTARSGWHAVERVRQFLGDHAPHPIETYHIGRVPKYLQLEHLLSEYADRQIVYLEDNADHISTIVRHFDEHFPAEDRLTIRRVRRAVADPDHAQLRQAFTRQMEQAGVPTQ